MTVNYVYLGYGTTDENGECKLDHDANGDSISHSYTGTGAGKIDVVASLDSPSSISDSSLVSETYGIIDGFLSDINGVGNIDYRNSSSGNINRDNTGTEFTANTIGTMSYFHISTDHTNVYNFKDKGAFVMEFDLLSYTDESCIEIVGNDETTNKWITSRRFAETGHYKYVIGENRQYLIVNNGNEIELNNYDISTFTNRRTVGINSKNKTKINNVVFYPI